MVDLSQGRVWWLGKGVCRNPSDGRAARAIDCPSLGSTVGTTKTVEGYYGGREWTEELEKTKTTGRASVTETASGKRVVRTSCK